jgi:AbrB family looped-hinge helix DNA binding protein
MPLKTAEIQSCCAQPKECCRVEAVVAVDGRGQLVLPKEVRENMKLAPGDKLAIITMSQAGEPCCMVMIKAENLATSARQMLGPMLKEL